MKSVARKGGAFSCSAQVPMGLIGQIMCLILGVGAGQRPFFMGKVIRIDFPARTKSVSGY